MHTRPRLLTSIPFWVLVVGSLAAIIGGLAIVLNGITAMEEVLNDPNATVVQVYVGQSWVVVGAAVLGAGAVGIVAVLALGAASALTRRPDVAVESIDWSSDDETVAEPAVAAYAPAAAAAPIAVEDADVETPSTATAPARATAEAGHDAPKLDAGARHDEPRLDAGDDATRR
ncbi:dinucleotide-utilizing enzyme [Microbacterium sp. lyk4-40-TSB-66]|uniref:dinucleotide-utilizing enzyme n=1 Tax=Microbacterium sp. lyk4-40-TSB-66 TaxID=3040294 RepID=UPI0025508FD0|nr:dinucleotide-utilizing enzyme [Microbacterium sp. lyk4-40-TSB-66]